MPYHQDRRRKLAACLKQARKLAGLSASQASARMRAHGLRCTRGTLLAWERGIGITAREPFASDLIIVASVYGCAVDHFFKCEAHLVQPASADE